MSKFNATKDGPEVVENHVGAKAFKHDAKLELVTMMLTTFVQDSYYRKESDMLNRLKELLHKEVDPLFAAKAAIYARTVFGMRSISHVVAGELTQELSGKVWAKAFYDKIIYRVDDILEIISYYNQAKEGKIRLPHAMQKGFGAALGRFDEYAIAKYRGENKEVKLIDAVNLIRPVPTDKNREALRKLMKNELVSTETWEAKLTQAGQKAGNEEEKMTLKKEAWIDLVKTKKIKFMAVLRNLRNIIQQAPEAIDGAIEILTDPAEIKKSLVLPFRYLTAYNEIKELTAGSFEKDKEVVEKTLKAIEKAITLSIDNIPTLTGRTIILSDNSGSMGGDGGGASVVSAMSKTTTANIANLFATMYWTKCDNTMVGLFGDRLITPLLDRERGLFENFKQLSKDATSCGPGTEAGIFDMFRKMIKEKIICDTAVIFSDCQIGDSCKWYSNSEQGKDFDKLFKQYKAINPNFRAYSVDLKGYGTTVFDGSVIKISGWSEKIFEIMKFAEQDKKALITEIEKINLEN